MKKVLFLLLTIIVVESVFYLVLSDIRERRIGEYYIAQSNIHRSNFNSSIAAYEQILSNIFKNRLDVEEVKVLMKNAQDEPELTDKYRNWLRMYCLPIYESMKSVGVTHMHFHLPDGGVSFLRLHKPFFYGDDTSEFRPSVVMVNTKHEL